LLQGGAKVDAALQNGFTALMIAAGKGHAEVAQVLLQGGAKVDAVDKDGGTALMYAAQNGHKEVVKILKQAGANKNKRRRR
jgi:ankyrin repeat protein